MFGVLIGDGIIFFAGRLLGDRVKSTWLYKRVMTTKNDQKTTKVFEKYGDKVVFMARFMPGLRMPIFLSAGLYRVSPLKFFALDGFAALISVPVWIWVGWVFGDNLDILSKKIRQFQIGVYVLLAVLVLGFILHYWLRKKAERQSLR
jgi:membrane protein DedA with SNARE-associated domain